MTPDGVRILLGAAFVAIGLVLVLNLGGFNDRQRERNRRREARGETIGWYAQEPRHFRMVGALLLAAGASFVLMGLL